MNDKILTAEKLVKSYTTNKNVRLEVLKSVSIDITRNNISVII